MGQGVETHGPRSANAVAKPFKTTTSVLVQFLIALSMCLGFYLICCGYILVRVEVLGSTEGSSITFGGPYSAGVSLDLVCGCLSAGEAGVWSFCTQRIGDILASTGLCSYSLCQSMSTY